MHSLAVLVPCSVSSDPLLVDVVRGRGRVAEVGRCGAENRRAGGCWAEPVDGRFEGVLHDFIIPLDYSLFVLLVVAGSYEMLGLSGKILTWIIIDFLCGGYGRICPLSDAVEGCGTKRKRN